jgi:hypothetical protein
MYKTLFLFARLNLNINEDGFLLVLLGWLLDK